MNTFEIALDVDKLTRAQPPVVIAQGDRNGTTIAAKVYDHGTLLTQSGLSARFKVRLPDGRYFYSKAATWTASTGTASVTIDETQAASAVGTTTCAYFELLSGTTVVYSTSRFTVRVLRSATDMSAQADSYDDRVEEIIAAMDVAVEAVEDAQEAAASANSAAASANTAASNANTARDNANSAASAANSAASTATSAAGTASNAASNANGAAQTANAAATSANDAATAANTAAERAEAIAEYSVPPMSPTTRGGAKLGSGLSMDGDVLSVALESESDGTGAGPIVELTAKGWAEQVVTTGKNLLDAATFLSDVANGYKTKNLQLSPNTTYVMSTTLPKNNDSSANLFAFKTGESGNSSVNGVWAVQSRTVTTGSDGIVVIGYRTQAYTDNSAAWYLSHEIQLELGSTATSYEPYTGGAPSPSPDYPQEIQVVTGHEVTGKTGRFVDLVVKQGNTTLSTTPIPLPSRGWVGALPDGTADVLTLDGAGKVVWEMATDERVFDGSEAWDVSGSGTSSWFLVTQSTAYDWKAGLALYSTHYIPNTIVSSTDGVGMQLFRTNNDVYGYLRVRESQEISVEDFKARLAQNPVTVLYPLATPVTEDMGYVDGWTNDFPEGCVLSIPELDALNVRYVVDDAAVTLARQWYERARSEYEDRIAALEEAVAELVAGS